MREDKPITRDEFLYSQIQGNRSLNRGLAFVYAAATVAAAAMAVATVVLGRFQGTLIIAGMGIGLGFNAWSSWNQHKDFEGALEEIGPDPTGVDTCRTYSAKTAQLIGRSRRDSKTLRQLWIAYGIVAIMMIALGILLTVLMIDLDSGIILTALGVGLALGGVVLAALTVTAFRDWRAAKYLESLE